MYIYIGYKYILLLYSSKQEGIYNITTRHIVESVLEGYNGSIIAYGQTGMLSSVDTDNNEEIT